MNKAILISIRPEHVLNILNGKKTLELRKRVPKDFTGWVYIYVTKSKPILFYQNDTFVEGYALTDTLDRIRMSYEDDELNGRVVARFWFDEYDIIKGDFEPDYFGEIDGELYIGNLYDLSPITTETIAKMACIDEIELIEYFEDVNAKAPNYVVGYAWHIKNLEIFDEPMELSEFYKVLSEEEKAELFEYDLPTWKKVTRAPKSYQYVCVKEKENEL